MHALNRQSHWKNLLLLALIGALMALPGSWGVRPARAGEAVPAAPVSWDYQVDFTADTLLTAREQAASLQPELRSQGVSTAFELINDSDYRLEMKGNEDLEQLRQVLYSDDLAGFIGGAAEVEIDLPMAGTESLTLQLESNLTTGYGWEFLPDESMGVNQAEKTGCVAGSSGYGVPCVQSLILQGAGDEAGKIRLAYRRPFGEAEAATRHLTVTLFSPLQQLDLSNPHPLTVQIPTSLDELASGDALPSDDPATLPASLDWRSAGIVPSVRNQGPCGSCWAFGTVGIMESAIAKNGGPLLNLSEQFLVSCNTYGWSCDGGLTAHMFHYNTPGKNQTSTGAVLESDDPYTATDSSCGTAFLHPYKLSGWHYVGYGEWSTPTTSQIKAAIAANGPVTAAICAGDAFQDYRGGIFSTNETCTWGTNHQIILVGWNDADGGYWILRNSWGSWWGESGYMRIAYGTSMVGEGTSWVEWDGARYKSYLPVATR